MLSHPWTSVLLTRIACLIHLGTAEDWMTTGSPLGWIKTFARRNIWDKKKKKKTKTENSFFVLKPEYRFKNRLEIFSETSHQPIQVGEDILRLCVLCSLSISFSMLICSSSEFVIPLGKQREKETGSKEMIIMQLSNRVFDKLPKCWLLRKGHTRSLLLQHQHSLHELRMTQLITTNSPLHYRYIYFLYFSLICLYV